MFVEGYEELARQVKDIVDNKKGGTAILAKECGVTRAYVLGIAKGKNLRPSAESLQKIADGVLVASERVKDNG